MRVPAAPAALVKVIFQVGVTLRDFGDVRRGGLSQRNPAQIRVQNDAGGVDDPFQGIDISRLKP